MCHQAFLDLASAQLFGCVVAMETTNTITTAKRVYHLEQCGAGLWSAWYRVINPATGHEWQGIKRDRKVTGTHFATYSYDASGAVVYGPVTAGKFAWGVTAFASPGIRGASVGFLTREELVAAIHASNSVR